MTSMVLNDITSRTAIGDVLAAATGSIIEIKDETGKLVAEIVLHSALQSADSRSHVQQVEADIEEIRRRRSADRAHDVSTKEMLQHAESKAEG